MILMIRKMATRHSLAMMARHGYGQAVLLAIVFMHALFGLSSCADRPCDLEQYDGTLLVSTYDGIRAIEMSSGSEAETRWSAGPRASELVPRGPGGFLLLVMSAAPSGDSTLGYVMSSGAVFRYHPLSSEGDLVEELSRGAYYCVSIDYCHANSTYLYCGTYKNKSGTFLLDSTFSLLKDLTPLYIEDDTLVPSDTIAERIAVGPVAIGCFLDSNKVLLDISTQGIFLVALSDSSIKHLSDGSLLAASQDGRRFATNSYSEGRWQLRVFDFDNALWSLVDEDEFRMSWGCFSPDGQALTYTKTEGFLDDMSRVWLFDTRTGKSCSTEIRGGTLGSQCWIEEELLEIWKDE